MANVKFLNYLSLNKPMYGRIQDRVKVIKTICKWRRTKITRGKNNPIYSIHNQYGLIYHKSHSSNAFNPQDNTIQVLYPRQDIQVLFYGLAKTINVTGVKKFVAGLEIKHSAPVKFVRSSTTAVNMWISTVNIASITTVYSALFP